MHPFLPPTHPPVYMKLPHLDHTLRFPKCIGPDEIVTVSENEGFQNGMHMCKDINRPPVFQAVPLE